MLTNLFSCNFWFSCSSDDQQEYVSQEPTPEPNERYSSEPEPVESPVERESSQPVYNYDSYDTSAGWGGYDLNDAWADDPQPQEPEQPADISTLPPPIVSYATDDISASSSPPPPSSSLPNTSTENSSYPDTTNYDDQTAYHVTVDAYVDLANYWPINFLHLNNYNL